jgi:hypothetical protein
MAPNRMQLCQAFESAVPAVNAHGAANVDDAAGAVEQAVHAVQQLGAQSSSGSSSSSARAVTR